MLNAPPQTRGNPDAWDVLLSWATGVAGELSDGSSPAFHAPWRWVAGRVWKGPPTAGLGEGMASACLFGVRSEQRQEGAIPDWIRTPGTIGSLVGTASSVRRAALWTSLVQQKNRQELVFKAAFGVRGGPCWTMFELS